jgi:hypothetical protein
VNTEDDMTESSGHLKPPGIFITLREIHTMVGNIDEKLDKEISTLKEEISKIKAQLAAQWVVMGILITTIAFLIQKGLTSV